MGRLAALFTVLLLAAGACLGARADEVVPVVSAKGPVPALSQAQIADIFLGKTTRYPDGSPAMPIDQNEDSPAREKFYAQFTGKSPAQVKAHWSKIIFTGRGQPPRQLAGGAEVRRAVAETPGAIGYIDSKLVDSSVRVVPVR
jgi:ABC-type phosphate transport system substrate-binding protein